MEAKEKSTGQALQALYIINNTHFENLNLGAFAYYSSFELLEESDKEKLKLHGEQDCGLFDNAPNSDYFKIEDGKGGKIFFSSKAYQALEYQGPALITVG